MPTRKLISVPIGEYNAFEKLADSVSAETLYVPEGEPFPLDGMIYQTLVLKELSNEEERKEDNE